MTKLKLQIESMVYGGAGLAHAEGNTFFVPYTLPHETVLAMPTHASRGHMEASLLQVTAPAAGRTEPACGHFGTCGGCQYQHAVYPTQLAIKKQILLDTLQRAGVIAPQDVPIHYAEPWHYRNRIQLRVQSDKDAVRIGYSQRASHDFLPILQCPITAQAVWQAAQHVEALLATHRAFASMALHEMEIFLSPESKEIQISFFLDVTHAAMERESAQHFRVFCTALKNELPTLHGAGLWVRSNESKERHRTTLEVARFGADATVYPVGQQKHTVQRGGFFQINQSLILPLLKLATQGRGGQQAWDLYAGVGLFTQQLAQTFTAVTSVEMGDRSYASLATLAAQLGKPHRAVHADTLAWLRGEARRLPTPDLIVVDPPRAGLGKPVVAALQQIAAREIVYVSCDPTTLSRDLQGLIESGYCLAELHLVDMFPQTFHMETVAVLTR